MSTSPVIDIVGVPEIAERVGVKPSRVAKWAQRGLLGEHEWRAGGSKLWRWENVQQRAHELAGLTV